MSVCKNRCPDDIGVAADTVVVIPEVGGGGGGVGGGGVTTNFFGLCGTADSCGLPEGSTRTMIAIFPTVCV